MALTITNRGTGTHNTGATTLVCAPTSTIPAGSLGILAIALDNAGSGGATAASPTTITDSVGNKWFLRQNPIYDPGAASAGIEGAIYTAHITTALTSANNVTVTWVAGVSPVAKVYTFTEVTPGAGNRVEYLTGATLTNAGAANPTITTSSITSGDVVFAGYFSENVAAVTADADTTNGSWSTQQTTTIGSTTSGVRIATQGKVTTGTGTQTYNPTVAAQDDAVAWISLDEVPITVSATFTADSILRKTASATFTADAVIAAGGPSVALVVGNNASPTPGDIVIHDRLIALGFTVTYISQSATAVTGYVMVFISESCSAGTVLNKYNNSASAVMLNEPGVVADMDMGTADATPGSSDANIDILDSSSYLAGGLSGTVAMVSPASRIDFIPAANLAASAQKIYGLTSGSTNIVGFGYLAGATMANSHVAEARRFYFGIPDGTIDSDLTANGNTLFDRAALWTAGLGATTVSGSFTADSVLKATQSGSFTADSVLKKTASATFTADAYLMNRVNASITADAVLKATSSFTFTADSVFKSTFASAFTADSVLRKTASATFTADAYMIRVTSATFTADAVLRSIVAQTITADAVLRVTSAATFTADAVLKKTIAATYTADAVLLKTASGSFTADSYLIYKIQASITADAVLRASVANTFTADAYLLSVVSGSFTANAVLLKTTANSFTADAYLSTVVNGTFTSDAVLRAVRSSTFTADAYLLAVRIQTFTADAVLKNTTQVSFNADAVLKKTSSATFTADATLRTGGAASITADAVLRAVNQSSFTADAILRKVVGGTFTADAYLLVVTTVSNAFTADAILKTTQSTTLNANAVLRAFQTGTVDANAVLKGTYSGSWVADAILRSVTGSTFTADAYLARVVADVFTADAVLFKVSAFTFTADASITTGVTVIDVTADVDETIGVSGSVEETLLVFAFAAAIPLVATGTVERTIEVTVTIDTA